MPTLSPDQILRVGYRYAKEASAQADSVNLTERDRAGAVDAAGTQRADASSKDQNDLRDFNGRAAGAIMGAAQGMGTAMNLGPKLPQAVLPWSAPVGIPLGIGLGGLGGYYFPGAMGALAGLETGIVGGNVLGRAAGELSGKGSDSPLARTLALTGAAVLGIPLAYLGYKLTHVED